MGEAFITRRGGGAGLALKVLGGTSTPDHVKNNTIWVNTDTAITSYALQHDQPLNPTPGMVWIQTSYFSFAEMDVDKKNDVKVYPIAAFQHIGGEWVDKEAKSYINGQWKDWVVTVWNGESDISKWKRAQAAGTGTWYYTEDGFLFTGPNSYGGVRIAYMELFDLTNIATVRYYGYGTGSGVNRHVSVVADSSSEFPERGDSAARIATPDSWDLTDPLTYVDLDVSNLTGNHYVRIGDATQGNNKNLYFKRVVLIPIGGNI